MAFVVNVWEDKLLESFCVVPPFDQSGDCLRHSANYILVVCSKRGNAIHPRKLGDPCFRELMRHDCVFGLT